MSQTDFQTISCMMRVIFLLIPSSQLVWQPLHPLLQLTWPLQCQVVAGSACRANLEFRYGEGQVQNASLTGCGRYRAHHPIASTSNRTVPVPVQILDDSRPDFDFLNLNGSLYGQGSLFLNHQSVRISNVVFQLSKSCPLAKDTRNLRQPTHEPWAILPILELKTKWHYIRWWRRRESNPRPKWLDLPRLRV